jgi:dipeptidyl-peptidase-3
MVEENPHKKDIIPVETSIHAIACRSSWEQLSSKEQAYAYFMSRACWEGSKICWFQCSYESPGLFVLLQLIFQNSEHTHVKGLHDRCIQRQICTEEEFTQFLAYCAAVFQNTGNFKSFGDTKFVPELHNNKFLAIVKASEAYE